MRSRRGSWTSVQEERFSCSGQPSHVSAMSSSTPWTPCTACIAAPRARPASSHDRRSGKPAPHPTHAARRSSASARRLNRSARRRASLSSRRRRRRRRRRFSRLTRSVSLAPFLSFPFLWLPFLWLPFRSFRHGARVSGGGGTDCTPSALTTARTPEISPTRGRSASHSGVSYAPVTHGARVSSQKFGAAPGLCTNRSKERGLVAGAPVSRSRSRFGRSSGRRASDSVLASSSPAAVASDLAR